MNQHRIICANKEMLARGMAVAIIDGCGMILRAGKFDVDLVLAASQWKEVQRLNLYWEVNTDGNYEKRV